MFYIMVVLLVAVLILLILGVLRGIQDVNQVDVLIEVNTFKEFYFLLGVFFEPLPDNEKGEQLTIGLVFININILFYK